MTPEELAADPAVRAAVLTTVTVDEALRTLRSRAGKPWCDALLLKFTDGLDESAPGDSDVGSGAREVLGLPQDYARSVPHR